MTETKQSIRTKEYYELNRDECIKAINDILSSTNDLWILWTIYLFSVGMTKDEEGGAV